MAAPLSYIRLMRLHQWSKGVFTLVGPAYALRAHERSPADVALGAACAFVAFGLMSSACYAINDSLDVERDRTHPRKRLRPLASGAISIPAARTFAAILAVAALLPVLLLPTPDNWRLAAMVVLYGLNVIAYSITLKKRVVADVMSLSMGFVLRVVGGCFAAAVMPTTWLLTCTLFLSMFLAFGKRLGERRTLGSAEAATLAREVQATYTDEILRMLCAITGIACLVIYSGYVVDQTTGHGPQAFLADSLLWATLLPSTYALLRAIVLLETGRYDDPTELATRDRPFQLASLVFVAMTVGAIVAGRG